MTTTIKNTFEAITDYLNELTNSELVQAHNQYCQNQNYSDDEIYSNDESFFEMFFQDNVLEAVRAVSYGDYSYSNDYVIFNGYANLESFNNPADHVDITAIAADILESPEEYDIELEEEEENEEK